MKKIFLCSLLITLNSVNAQIGINTKFPKSAFHIDGLGNNPEDGSNPSSDEQLDDFIINKEGQVGIGTINPSALSSLEIAVKKPLRLPRLTTIQRDSLSGSAPMKNGLLIYNSTTNCFSYWIKSIWTEICNDLVKN
ncbi:hypothetical protein [Apibacter sp. HY039]|uniref:hypothetical protein n=1 Tax=Apibacter sp. HY039 TaxID=2501476 RepID=UPI000FEBCE13|nr:hypothetical protein [Apibacter sp. HY039]